jgi:hypothetical protein
LLNQLLKSIAVGATLSIAPAESRLLSHVGSLQPGFTLWIPESRNSGSILGFNYDKEAKRSSSHDSQLEDDVDARAGSKWSGKSNEIWGQACIKPSAGGLLGRLFKPDSANGNQLAADARFTVLRGQGPYICAWPSAFVW